MSTQDDDLICVECNGCGLGQYEGTSCGGCDGSGVENKAAEQQRADCLAGRDDYFAQIAWEDKAGLSGPRSHSAHGCPPSPQPPSTD